MGDIRDDFPFLRNHPKLIYFDNAATSLKPQEVIDEVSNYYENIAANIHRGDYKLSHLASNKFDESRQTVADFINANTEEIVFTSGASESLNLVAIGYGQKHLKEGDVILLNETEHASNLLPWYALAKRNKLKLEFIKTNEQGDILLHDFEQAMHSKVKLVSIAHSSNVLAYIRDIKNMSAIAHSYGAIMVVDGAQTVGHINIDVQDLGVDFFAFSGHKMFAPSGVGVLYGKKELLEETDPIFYGGGSNHDFGIDGLMTLKKSPLKFESGTPNIEGVLGLKKAIDYINSVGIDYIHRRNQELYNYAYTKLSTLKHLVIYNPNADLSIISFNVDGIFAQDVAQYLDSFNIAVRTGDHCAKAFDPSLKKTKTIRLSMHFYNNEKEIDILYEALKDITLEKCIDLYI